MTLSKIAPWLLPILLLAGCQTPPAIPPAELAVEPGAAAWAPMLLESAGAVRPAAPVHSAAELDELKAWQGRRTADDLKAIAYWNDQAATLRWAELTRETILKKNLVPPRASRALGLVHAAMYDAVIASWEAKAAYRRGAPVTADATLTPVIADAGIPSYPSEHAAVAMAAATTLGHLFPDEKEAFLAKAQAAAETRVAAGANFRSDLTAGMGIGTAVAGRAIAWAQADGSDAKATLPLQAQPGQWTHTAPMEPLAGSWKTWGIQNAQYQLPAPPAPTQAEIDEVVAVSGSITDAQRERARYWNFDVPSVIWTERAEGLLSAKKASTPRAARVLGYLNTMMSDAFVTCWASKYAILRPRPVHLAPGFQSVFATPPHPSYPSGHATCSAAAATYLAAAFPEDAAALTAEAEEAAMSRLWAGIHYRSDNDDGLVLGRRIGAAALEKARADGLP